MNDRAARVWAAAQDAFFNQQEKTGDGGDASVAIIAAYGQEQYRAGVEAANDAGIKAIFPDGDYSANTAATLDQALCRFKKKIYRLLAEQEEKG